jgi:hypothetical protein
LTADTQPGYEYIFVSFFRFRAFSWNGIDIVLPPVKIEHVYLFKASDGFYNLHMAADDNFRVSLLANKNDTFEDVFAVQAARWNIG